ncbi:helix-turn-helix transcriptional regulator [Nonomuraea fuscirosea]|uniref:helix-turn-helix transcriptional regulator n=1 Tax=Nonomuraea fuscirosea TaxID=1291556 RepID=UPI002DDBF2A8|nr:helix-turn-helix transcriptional regulator [Nonomuraea fuscirosea]WSA57463.1 helix-turn-helix transcriptional regulator [Nonomuraea fuscirosea]
MRLWEHTRGNPLHARALLEVVPPAVLRDPWARLPAPETYRRIFARRLRSCAPATRRLVSACAVLGEECPLHVAVTVAREVGRSLDALEVDKRLDTLEGGERLDAWAVGEPSAATGVGERFEAAGVGESVDGLEGSRRLDPLEVGGRFGALAVGEPVDSSGAGGRFDALGVRESLDALEEAVGAGLLRESPGRMVGFVEPLARAAAYDGIGAGMRARLHLAASRVTEDTGAALRHRAAAAGGPDELLAEELAGYAAKAAQHGLWQEAAAHLDLAAGLTESAACRDELRTAVLEHVLIGGDVLRAAELAAVRNADPRPVRRYVLGRLALAAGRFEEASELLAEAWRHAEPGFAADVAEQLAWLRLVTGDRGAAADWARLAIEQPIQGMAARPYDVLALAEQPCAGAPPGSLAAAVTLLARDEPGQARAMLGRAAGAAAPAHHRLLATTLLAVAEHACTRWDKAAAHAEYAFAQAAALGQRWLLPSLEAACVAPLAALGEHVRALTHATEAAATARRLGHVMGERQAALALALLTPGETPPAAHLPPAPSTASGMYGVPGAGGDRELGGGPDVFVPDARPARIEALVADGRLEEAERALAAFDREGTRYDGDRAWQSGEEGRQGGEGVRCDGEEVWRGSEEARRGDARRRAERARLRGLLLAGRNAPAQAEEAFVRALSLVEAGVCPLEEARVLLDLGRLLRRTGRRKVAAERLGAARAIFERLGARPLAERCGKELEACGMEPPATARLGLTPQELSTATLVAGGLTNRQIARELLISVKTVEYHIGKIYTKLGISSRVALAAKLAV